MMIGRLYRALLGDLVRQKVVVGGERAAATILTLHLRRAHDSDIQIVGTFCSDIGTNRPDDYVDDLIEYGKHHPVDWVLLASEDKTEVEMEDVVGRLKVLNVHVALCPDVSNAAANRRLPVADLGGVPVRVLAERPIGRLGLLLKALEDKVLAALLLLFILPLMIIIAITIRLDSPGPVLFRQRRHGLSNVEFEIFKFRTMSATNTPPGEGLKQTQRNDARITRVGQFLRRSSLDELPQLFNVLRGEMSLVGPRPHPTAMRTENRLGPEIIAHYPQRHRVKPGMTGWAQINGYRGATATTDQVRRRVECDMFYIENWSLFFDLKILALTPIKMIQNNDTAF